MSIKLGTEKTKRNPDFLFIGLMAAILAIYLWKIDLGMAYCDETFYLSIPFRMAKGDCLIVDEWHVSQLWSFLIYPIMEGYLALHPNTEGMVLTFRYIFLFWNMFVTCIAYILLKKRFGRLAAVSCAAYALFVPFGIMALSYNSLGLSIAFLLAVINLEVSENKWKHIVSGILTAGLVLCNPFTICIYLLYTIYLLRKKHWRNFVYLHIGILVLFIPFLMHIFTRASLTELRLNLPNALSDELHPGKTIITFLKPIGAFVLRDYVLYTVAFCAVSVAVLLNKKRKKVLGIGLIFITMLTVIWLAVFATQELGANAVMLPLTPLGIVLFLTKEKKDWRLFCSGLLFPVLYALCMNLSSDQGMNVISNACTVSSCISILIIYEWLEENSIDRRELVIILAFIFIGQIGSEAYIAFNHVFLEEQISMLNCEIGTGPLKGIRTTQENKETYERMVRDILELKISKDEHILFYRREPVGYLIADAGFGAFTTYNEERGGLKAKKLVKYFELHPDKIPDIIFVMEEAYKDMNESEWDAYCEENGYSMSRGASGSYILRKQD